MSDGNSSADGDSKSGEEAIEDEPDSSCHLENQRKDYRLIKLPVTRKEIAFRHALYPDIFKVLADNVLCTSCFINLKNDVSMGRTLYFHPVLNVLQCKKCVEFRQDSNCDELICMWCREETTHFSCISCTSQLCEDCIKANLGRRAFKDAEKDDWKCVLCNPALVWPTRAKSWAAFQVAENVNMNRSRAILEAQVEKRKHQPVRSSRLLSVEVDAANCLNLAEASSKQLDGETVKRGEWNSGADSEDIGGSSKMAAEVRSSEESDASSSEEVRHSSNGKTIRTTMMSRGSCVKKHNELEDKPEVGTPRTTSAIRARYLKHLPRKMDMAATPSSDSSSGEGDAQQTEIDDVKALAAVGQMISNQTDTIRKYSSISATLSSDCGVPLQLLRVIDEGLRRLKSLRVKFCDTALLEGTPKTVLDELLDMKSDVKQEPVPEKGPHGLSEDAFKSEDSLREKDRRRSTCNQHENSDLAAMKGVLDSSCNVEKKSETESKKDGGTPNDEVLTSKNLLHSSCNQHENAGFAAKKNVLDSSCDEEVKPETGTKKDFDTQTDEVLTSKNLLHSSCNQHENAGFAAKKNVLDSSCDEEVKPETGTKKDFDTQTDEVLTSKNLLHSSCNQHENAGFAAKKNVLDSRCDEEVKPETGTKKDGDTPNDEVLTSNNLLDSSCNQHENAELAAKRGVLDSSSDEEEKSKTKAKEVFVGSENEEALPRNRSVDSSSKAQDLQDSQVVFDDARKRAEATQKKRLLDSSSDESDGEQIKQSAAKESVWDSSSDSSSSDDPTLGNRRPLTEDKTVKERKGAVESIDIESDLKLKADCFVDLPNMSEQDRKDYLLSLQEDSLKELSTDWDKELESLGNFKSLQQKRDCSSNEEAQSNRTESCKKPKTKEKSLMDFLVDDDTDEDDSGDGSLELKNGSSDTKEVVSVPSGTGTWNGVNKEDLLVDSDHEPESDPELGEEKPDITPKAKKIKEKPAPNSNVEKEDGGNSENESASGSQKAKSSWRRDKLLVMKLSATDSSSEENLNLETRGKRMKEEERKKKEPNSQKRKRRRRVLKSDSGSESDFDDTFSKKRKKRVSRASGADSTGISDGSLDDVFANKKKIIVSKESSEDRDGGEVKTLKRKTKRRRIGAPGSSSGENGNKLAKLESPTKGVRRFKRMMRPWELLRETREAVRTEDERIKRIAERQKMYEEMDEARQANATAGRNIDKLVLDFDEETKEPLVEVHPRIVAQLKPHQADGVKFMWDACYESVKQLKKTKGTGCILAHCMGLGKTLQAVALSHTLVRNPECQTRTILVVAPAGTVLNWCYEFGKWQQDLEEEDVIRVYNVNSIRDNIARERELRRWHEFGGVMVIGYTIFRLLSNPNSKSRIKPSLVESFQKSLLDPGPDLVICDEGHLLKNEMTALAISMSKIKTSRRIVLTGTPLQNNLKEYHCMVQFVKPNLLGSKKEFYNQFVHPITRGQFGDSSPFEVRVMKRRAHVLHKMLEGSVQRYDYSVLTPFLPIKQEYVISIRVTPNQEILYRYYLENESRIMAGDEDGRVLGKGAKLFKDFNYLQRLWTHPLLLKWHAVKEEKRRVKVKSESEGSMKDFIDDDEIEPKKGSSSSEGDGSNEEEKIKKEDTNTVEDESKDVAEENPEQPRDWWEQFVTQNHFDDLRESPKLVLLFSILKECEAVGEKLLIFSQSLYSLDLIEHFLEKVDEATQKNEEDEKLLGHKGSWTRALDYFRLDGSTPTELRAAWCKTFNKESNTRARLFLISTRAGGLGINLVAANRVIIFDASWNPSNDVQSIFRVYRFGQKKPVFVYRFLAQGTMEETIYERQVTKLSLAGRVVDEHQIDRYYTMADLQALYRFTPSTGPRPTPMVPKDHLLADLLQDKEERIVKYHEHDSLLENKEDEVLNEQERKEAWEDYEKEKNRHHRLEEWRDPFFSLDEAPATPKFKPKREPSVQSPALSKLAQRLLNLAGEYSDVLTDSPADPDRDSGRFDRTISSRITAPSPDHSNSEDSSPANPDRDSGRFDRAISSRITAPFPDHSNSRGSLAANLNKPSAPSSSSSSSEDSSVDGKIKGSSSKRGLPNSKAVSASLRNEDHQRPSAMPMKNKASSQDRKHLHADSSTSSSSEDSMSSSSEDSTSSSSEDSSCDEKTKRLSTSALRHSNPASSPLHQRSAGKSNKTVAKPRDQENVDPVLPPNAVDTSPKTSLLELSGPRQLFALYNKLKQLSGESQKLFLMVAKRHLQSTVSDRLRGFLLKDLYWGTQKACIFSSQSTFRKSIGELEACEFVKTKIDRGKWTEWLIVPIDFNVVQQFVEIQEKKRRM